MVISSFLKISSLIFGMLRQPSLYDHSLPFMRIYFRINKYTFISLITRVRIFFILFKVFNYLDAVHDKQTDVFVNLRSRQTNAPAIVHGFPHILNQFDSPG